MSGAYPPGVTGSEYEIAGPDWEEDHDVECDATKVSVSVVDASARGALKNVKTYLESALDALGARNDPEEARRWLRQARFQADMATSETVDLETCGFVGTVTVQGYHGEQWWTCPLCETEHRSESD